MVSKDLALRTIGILGVGVFLAFLSLTFYVPGWVETFASEFIEHEVSKRVDSSIDALQPPEGEGALARLANSLYAENQQQIDAWKASLKAGAHEKMADALAEVRNLDCACRDKWASEFERRIAINVTGLQEANEKLVDFIQSSYMETVENLKRDIRIFAGSNALVFVFLVLVSFLKPQAIRHLFLPGMLLVLCTLICSYFYIFEQNWLLTLIYNDFLGYLYSGYLAIVFGFLCDIVFNRCRITTAIVNAILEAIGSSIAALVPC